MLHFKRSGRAGFTINELLVVISIIAVLVALTVIVVGKVAGAGKQRLTEQTLKTLESALETYVSATGNIPPATVEDPRPGGNRYLIPVVDGRNCPGGNPAEPINAIGLFVLQCQAVPQAIAAIKNLDSKLVREYDPDQTDPAPNSPNYAQQPKLLTVFDGWGNPIHYVHPTFKGVVVKDITLQTNPSPVDTEVVIGLAPPQKFYGLRTIRRADGYYGTGSQVDADGGIPLTNKPYFYSAGPDGDPSTIDDNVYITRPRFPKRD